MKTNSLLWHTLVLAVALTTTPLRADDTNLVAYAPWGDPEWTTNDFVYHVWPDWMVAAFRSGGAWQTNPPAWHVSSEISNTPAPYLQLDVDRLILSNNLLMRTWFMDTTGAALYVDLVNTNQTVIATNVLGYNLLSGLGTASVSDVSLPLTNYADAVSIRLRRDMGEITIYGSLLTPDTASGGSETNTPALASVSGTVSYTGTQSGSIHVFAVTNSGAWSSPLSATLAAPGAYTLTGLPTQVSYWIRAYVDENANGSNNIWEAQGTGLPAPLQLVCDTTVNVALVEPDSNNDGLSDWAAMQLGLDPQVSNVCARLPFVELFETDTVQLGDINGQHGWVSDPTNKVFVQTNNVYEGQQALQINGGIATASVYQVFATTNASFIWTDLRTVVQTTDTNDTVTATAATAFFFNKEGRLVVLDGLQPAGHKWVTLTNVPPMTTGTWVRITYLMNFASQNWLICLNGTNVAENLGFGSTCHELHMFEIRGGKGNADNLYVAANEPSGLVVDGDALPDDWELQNFGSLGQNDSGDPDADDLTNLQEYQNGTDPNNVDTDSDGMTDAWEVANGLNPLSDADATLDSDADGLNNLAEYTNQADPHNADTDGDGLSDSVEVNTYLTSPILADTDGDGLSDKWEIDHGLNPLAGTCAIANLPAANVTTSEAVLQGYLSSTGSPATVVCVLWGEANGGTNATAWAHTNTWPANAWGDNSRPRTNLTELLPNTTYYYTFAAQKAGEQILATSSVSFITRGIQGAWWQNPTLKYVEDTGATVVSAGSPHFWNKDESDQYLFCSPGFDPSERSELYSIPALVAARASNQVAPLRYATPKSFYGTDWDYAWRGGAVSDDQACILTGNYAASHNTSLPLSTPWTTNGSVYLIENDIPGSLISGLGFSHDSSKLYSCAYSSASVGNRIYTWNVVNLAANGIGLASNAVFTTSLTYIENLSVYHIGGKDLVYYGEASGGGTVCVYDPQENTETELLQGGVPIIRVGSSIMNIKVGGVATGNMHLYVQCDSGALYIFDLAADGKSVGACVKSFTPTQLKTLLGATWNYMRVVEVTDDETHVFFSHTYFTTGQHIQLFVVWTAPAIQNLPATGVSFNQTTCNSAMTFAGGSGTSVGLLWGQTNGGTNWSAWANTNWFPAGAWGDNSFPSTNLTGLLPNTTYYYTFAARNAGGQVMATSSVSFVTTIQRHGPIFALESVTSSSTNVAALPFVENFETNTVQTGDLNGQNRWTASPAGAALVQTSAVQEGQQAMQLTADPSTTAVARQTVATPNENIVWLDLQTLVNGAADPAIEPNMLAAFYFDNAGQLVVCDGQQPAASRWLTLASQASTGAWARVTVRLDYTQQKWSVFLNGQFVADNLGFVASGTTGKIAFAVNGRNAFIDAVQITTNQPTGLSLDWNTLPDDWELAFFGSLGQSDSADPDGDGLTNLQEYWLGTDPLANDTTLDSDGDGISNYNEVMLYGTNPFLADSDGDGVSDWYEINTSHTDPLRADQGSDPDGPNLNVLSPVNDAFIL